MKHKIVCFTTIALIMIVCTGCAITHNTSTKGIISLCEKNGLTYVKASINKESDLSEYYSTTIKCDGFSRICGEQMFNLFIELGEFENIISDKSTIKSDGHEYTMKLENKDSAFDGYIFCDDQRMYDAPASGVNPKASTEKEETIALDAVSDAAKDAASALEAYKENLKNIKDLGAVGEEMIGAYEAAKKDIEAGLLNSPSILSFIDMTVPPEKQAELEHSAEKIIEFIQKGFLGKTFGAYNLARAFYDEIVQKVNDGTLDGIVTMDGENITGITSLEKLAEKLETTKAVAETMVDYLNQYWDTRMVAGDTAQKIWDETVKNMSTDSQSLREQIKAGTVDIEAFATEVQKQLGGASEIELINNIDGVLRALNIEVPPEMRSKISEAVNALFGNVTVDDESTAKVPVDADTSPAENAVSELHEKEESNPLNITVEANTQAANKFDQYLKDSNVTLNNIDVQYDQVNNRNKLFSLQGTATLSDYYNYGYDDVEKTHFCFEVTPTDGTYSDRWYIYCHRDSFKNVLEKAKENGSISVKMVCEITNWEKSQSRMAELEYIVY